MTTGIIDAERNLDTPPEGDEGGIRWVEFGYVDDRRRKTTHKECQACGLAVNLEEPHVRARGWRENSTGRVVTRPVFCNRECWSAWASRSTDQLREPWLFDPESVMRRLEPPDTSQDAVQ